MKIKIITAAVTYIILFSQYLLAQQSASVTITVSGFEILLANKNSIFEDEVKGQFTIRDYFEFTNESASGEYKLPSQELIVAIPANSKPRITISSFNEKRSYNILPALNPAVEMVSDSTIVVKPVDYSQKKVDTKPFQLLEIKGFFWFREFYCAHLKVNTHQYDEKNNVVIEYQNIKLKLEFDKKFDIKPNSPIVNKSLFDENLKLVIANSEIAEQFRSTPQIVQTDNSGSWINFTSNYLKIGTVEDGIFRIYKSDLDSLGISTTGVNPKTFQLFESGTEKPIYVFGESDLLFDAGDYIEFYGTKNYSKISARVLNPNNQPYNNYLDKYTDTTIYFLTWGIQEGKRPTENNVYQSSVADSIDYFTSFMHIEQNPMDVLFYTFHQDLVESQFPYWDTGKGWYWKFLATWSGPGIFDIPITDRILNKNAKFYAKLTSRGSTSTTNVHRTQFYANNVKIDSQVTNRYARILMNGTINTDLLNDGNNQIYLTYEEANGAANGVLIIDWIEAEYPKVLKMIDNSLTFQFTDLPAPAHKKLKIANVNTPDFLLYKIKPKFERITAYELVNEDLYFTDTLSNNDSYYIVRQTNYLKPLFFKYKSFTNIRNQNNQIDYLGITHPKFLTEVTDYVDFVAQNFNVTTALFSVEDIYDEFAYGYPTAESIKDFILYKFQNASFPKPSFLTFFGDANYDYKHYRTISQGIVGGGNYVPSYGFPVSDQIYAMWDTTSLRIPQLYVGRIPLNSLGEMDYYKSKVENNIIKPYDDWNKKYLFFSGGRAELPEEIALYKSVNDSVINNFIIPPPLAGVYKHFYKTTFPLTDFGPYTPEVINQTIAEGGVFLSYIGHSGTATWDNGISDVRQLKNHVNRNPVISDFGCSTNKFSEPDIVAFGERFVLDPNGQALNYIGNTGLGFVSTAIKAPGNFYKSVIKDTMFQVGKAHLQAKYLMFQQLGSSNVVNEFSFCNAIMGDPVVKMKVPNRPNLKVSQNDLIFENSLINDAMDSIKVKLVLNNYGTVIPPFFKMIFAHSYQSAVIQQSDITRNLPNYKDTLTFWVLVKDKPGLHTLSVNLDIEDSLAEIYEDDNDVTVSFNVASTSVRDLFILNRYENSKLDSLIVLNPTVDKGNSPSLVLQTADNESFLNLQEYAFPLDTFITKFNLSTPPSNERTWIRYKITDGIEWSSPLSYSKDLGLKYSIGDEYSWNKQNLSKLRVMNDGVEITIDTVTISILSAGSYSGQYCTITKNGINLLSNTFFLGIGIVVFDEKTLDVDTTAWFQFFNNVPGINAFIQFVDSIPSNKLIALGVSGDAKNNPSTLLNNTIVSLGGVNFPSLQYKAPYALLCKKGADSTQVVEIIKNPFEGPIQLDSTQIISLSSGILTSSQIGPASSWQTVKIEQLNQNDSEIKIKPIGMKFDSTLVPLPEVNLVNNEADLTSIPAAVYPYLKIQAELIADSSLNSPKLTKLDVDYTGIAEIGTNFQTVSINKDTLEQGEKGRISFFVYNAGEAPASNFKVEVEVIRPDNSSDTILTSNVSLNAGEHTFLQANYVTDFEAGSRIYKINIDPDENVFEYYKDNNFYSVPFFIKKDTTLPTLVVSFDGNEILDGDYVSPKPLIRMEISDPSILPIYDTSSLTIQMDERPVYFAKNTSTLSYQFNATNPKMIAEYRPTLDEGEHTLTVFANDGFGNLADSSGLQKKFFVSNETKMFNVYNYPNPTNNQTYFTFELTQEADEVKILIYTIAGRLIKEFVVPKSDLTANFNKVFWDCRDADGDLVGSGTYLYKVIMKAGDKTESSVHKLAIYR